MTSGSVNNARISYILDMSEKKKTLKKTIKKKVKTKTPLIKAPSLEEMLRAGVHFGHRSSRWNPKMKPYIFTTRHNVHVIDLEKTHKNLERALKFLQEIKDKNGVVLFVGTKVSAKKIVEEAAKECKMPFVTERWLGGTLTNFKIISERLTHLKDLEAKKKSDEWGKYTKKERHDFEIEINKLNQRFGGIKKITKLPDALFIADIRQDDLAAKEAKMKGIPSVGLCDTNTDPTSIDYPIPSNDDASSALKLMVGAVAEMLK